MIEKRLWVEPKLGGNVSLNKQQQQQDPDNCTQREVCPWPEQTNVAKLGGQGSANIESGHSTVVSGVTGPSHTQSIPVSVNPLETFIGY